MTMVLVPSEMLEAWLKKCEDIEEMIDNEWGSGRSIAKIASDGDLPQHIEQMRERLKVWGPT